MARERSKPAQLLQRGRVTKDDLTTETLAGMINYHTGGTVAKAKLAITLDRDLLDDIDALIAEREFANRSQAIEAAVAEKLARRARTRLARESAKLDPRAEKALAEEGLSADADVWPEY